MNQSLRLFTAAFPLALLPAAAFAEAGPGDFYRAASSYATTPETDPPRYVRTLGKTGHEALKGLYWLEGGLELRERFEYRRNDLRRPSQQTDTPLLQRTRLYVGVKELLDPLRFAVEVQDSRRWSSDYPADDRDNNPLDFVQGYGELHFKDALGKDAPLRLRYGRMAFEVLDRRLIARNEWRNTTNAFHGFRALVGQQKNVWDADAFALQPIRRNPHDMDDRIDRLWMFGGIFSWRKWSDMATIQPFYLNLRQDQVSTAQTRNIHSPGLRVYGVIPGTAWDFDTSAVCQFGSDGGRRHEAYAGLAELGYTFTHAWKPRLSANYGFATGDELPTGQRSERFERFFGFARPWSNNDYFQWENIHAPKLRLEVAPSKELRADAGLNAYWLDSRTDRWNAAGLRDATGRRGAFLGAEFDGRVRYKLHPLVDSTVGYAYFNPGEFTEKSGRGKDTHFVYVELSFRVFE